MYGVFVIKWQRIYRFSIQCKKAYLARTKMESEKSMAGIKPASFSGPVPSRSKYEIQQKERIFITWIMVDVGFCLLWYLVKFKHDYYVIVTCSYQHFSSDTPSKHLKPSALSSVATLFKFMLRVPCSFSSKCSVVEEILINWSGKPYQYKNHIPKALVFTQFVCLI